MKNLIRSFWSKTKATCLTNLPVTLFLFTRNQNGELINQDVFDKWQYYVVDQIPATFECLFDTVINYAMSKHYQIIQEEILIITIHNSDYLITTNDLEIIITALLKFGEKTSQNQVSYMLNNTTFNLPIS